jgi:lysyl-tRNA synthetase class 2
VSEAGDWRPRASREALVLRAGMLATLRQFFANRAVLEVETPLAVGHAISDPQLASARVLLPGRSAPLHLHTSPEFAMKRLLAAGYGDIYQVCHVFRGDEAGALHAAEFTLLEWYRIGWSMDRLIDEVDALLRELLPQPPSTRPSYQEVIRQHAGCDALTDSDAQLMDCAVSLGFDATLLRSLDRDGILDLLMGLHVGPRLGLSGPCYVQRFPASQASLARLDPEDSRVALRFELYLQGVELANGFEELADATEQRARFMNDRLTRRKRDLPDAEPDERLLAALTHGLPACSGVAMGFDRLVMQAAGTRRIEEVLSFLPGEA